MLLLLAGCDQISPPPSTTHIYRTRKNRKKKRLKKANTIHPHPNRQTTSPHVPMQDRTHPPPAAAVQYCVSKPQRAHRGKDR